MAIGLDSHGSVIEDSEDENPDTLVTENKEAHLQTQAQGLTPIYLNDAFLDRWTMKTGTRPGDLVQHKFIPKDKIIEEINVLQADSEFFEFQTVIEQFEGDRILLIRGPENQFDTNYLFTTTIDSFDDQIAEIDRKRDSGDYDDDEASIETVGHDTSSRRDRRRRHQVAVTVNKFDEEDVKKIARATYEELYALKDVVAKVKASRPPFTFQISQPRHRFGRPVEFNDLEPSEKVDEFGRQKINSYAIERLQCEMGFQAAPQMVTGESQTAFAPLLNKATQYFPATVSETRQNELLGSTKFKEFLRNSLDELTFALQSDETIDLFKDEFDQFEDDEVTLSNRVDSSLEVFHSFSHLVYSNNKEVAHVSWYTSPHNKAPGVAFSTSISLSFEDWVTMSGQIMTSHLLMYILNDPLHPRFILEVPGNLSCFQLHPTCPDFVVGGLITGQVLFWDLSTSSQNGTHSLLHDESSAKYMDLKKEDYSVTPIKPQCISSVDKSYNKAVTDIAWLPVNQQINKRGEIISTNDKHSSQFITVAGDGKLLFWDFRNKNEPQSKQNASGIMRDDGNDLKDSRWSPLFSLPLLKNENVYAHVVKFVFGAAKNDKLMTVTESGEIAEIDWNLRQNDDRSMIYNVVSMQRAHFQSALDIERSPHFDDVFLTVGDWTFAIWKIGYTFPVFRSPYSAEYLTCARWSPTRPGVVVTGRTDGTLEIWDLVDQCHKSSYSFNAGSSKAINCLKFWQSLYSNHTHQYLAAGDAGGKLHVIEVPRNLRRKIPHEEDIMASFYKREIVRQRYAAKRSVIRKATRNIDV